MQLFDKANRISGLLNAEGKKEKRLYTVLSVVFFVPGSILLWEFVYELSHMIGAIASRDTGYALYELIRMLPLTLVMLSFMHFSIFLHNAFIAGDIKARAGNWFKMGLFSGSFGIIIIVLVFAGLISGSYYSIVEGFPTLMFPLDTVLLAVVFVVFAVFSVKYSGKLKKNGSNIPFTVQRHCLFIRGAAKFLGILSFIVASAGFAACYYGLSVLDWSHGALFFNIMLWMNYFTAFIMFVLYRFVFAELNPDGGTRRNCLKGLSGSFLIINIILFVLYMLSMEIYPDAPNNNAFGLLPGDFMATVSIFPFIYGLNNILTPICGLIYCIASPDSGKKKDRSCE